MNIELNYLGKKSREQILHSAPTQALFHQGKKMQRPLAGSDWLIHGENFSSLKWLLDECKMKGKVDLIYIDPPFSTQNTFRFDDRRTATISSQQTSGIAYTDHLSGESFLEFIRERLILLHELLSEQGSIYLHIDYKIGHYIKILMDEVFGAANFRADIARIKCNPKNFHRRNYGNQKDLVLFYTKSSQYIWNEPKQDFSENEKTKLYPKIDAQGRRYATVPLHAPGETQNGPTGQQWRGLSPPPGRHWRCAPSELELLDKQGLIEWSSTGNPRKIIYADERGGRLMQDIWDFRDKPYPSYPTEKNIDLLKTIIAASSNPSGLVLDCFCGSGSTLAAAHELGRHAIGMDQSEVAIKVASRRWNDLGVNFKLATQELSYPSSLHNALPHQLALLQKERQYAKGKAR